MNIEFAKMHGAGNDFVVVRGAPPRPPDDQVLVRALADRRRGIGADGVLFLEDGGEGGALFRMHFYNADGGRAQLCLNGARCVAWRAWQLGWVTSQPFSFTTEAWRVGAEILVSRGGCARVRLHLPKPELDVEAVDLPSYAPAAQGYAVDTGDPHLVVEVDEGDLSDESFLAVAARLRHWTDRLPAGANVHFVHRRAEDSWRIRSFERGVEAETQACGSGCLSAVAALSPMPSGPIELLTQHGDTVQILPEERRWILEGPAVCVFEATYAWTGGGCD